MLLCEVSSRWNWRQGRRTFSFSFCSPAWRENGASPMSRTREGDHMMESTAQRAVKFARVLAAYFFLESLYCSFLDLSVMVLVIRLIICFSLVKSIDECELRLKLGAGASTTSLSPDLSSASAQQAQGQQQQQQVFTPFGANFFVTGNLNQPAAGGDHSNINSGPVSGSLEISTDLAAQVKGTRERWKMCLQCALPAIVLHLLWGFYPSSLPFLASSSSSCPFLKPR